MSKVVIEQLKMKTYYCPVCGSDDLILYYDADNHNNNTYRCNHCQNTSYMDCLHSYPYEKANKRYPFINSPTEAYVAAVNILAVEFLVKTNDREKYTRYVNKVSELDNDKLEQLYILLSLNMHTSTLGAMITQGDYDIQKGALLNFLNAEMVKCPNCGRFASAEYYGSIKNVKYYRCSCCANKFLIADEK